MSEKKNLSVNLNVWRRKRGEKSGKFVTYSIGDISPDSSFLEMLDLLNESLIKKGEEPVEAAPRELHGGSRPHVPGAQTQGHARSRLHQLEQLDHTGQDPIALAAGHLVGEKLEVDLDDPIHFPGVVGMSRRPQGRADDAVIRHAPEPHTPQAVGRAAHGGDGLLHGPTARTPREDEGAVEVEEEDGAHGWPRRWDLDSSRRAGRPAPYGLSESIMVPPM